MKKENKKLYSLRLHLEQLEYLKNKAVTEFTTVTQYVIDLVNKDMKENKKQQWKRFAEFIK